MSSVVISGDSSGTITLSAPAVAGTNTITLPAATGTVMVSGNMPAFSVYLAGSQTLSSNTVTKIAFDTKVFDTNTNYNTANNRFTPTVAGYYQFNGVLNVGATATRVYIQIYKNGSIYQSGADSGPGSAVYANSFSTIIYCNGTTDYVEMYGAFVTGQAVDSGSIWTWFNGAMIRGA